MRAESLSQQALARPRCSEKPARRSLFRERRRRCATIGGSSGSDPRARIFFACVLHYEIQVFPTAWCTEQDAPCMRQQALGIWRRGHCLRAVDLLVDGPLVQVGMTTGTKSFPEGFRHGCHRSVFSHRLCRISRELHVLQEQFVRETTSVACAAVQQCNTVLNARQIPRAVASAAWSNGRSAEATVKREGILHGARGARAASAHRCWTGCPQRCLVHSHTPS